MPNPTGMYERQDFERQQQRSREAAAVIIPLVLKITGARSVLDVGCGVGTWLAVCAEQGIDTYLGIDGFEIDPSAMLQIPRQNFRQADLREPLGLDRQYDLAMSLEVAEHLPPEIGPALVKQLTSAAPAVLFSAAIPGQTGPGHINERWPSYWADLFAKHDYCPVDEIRPAVWRRDDVVFWYRQNVILYLRRDRLPADYAPPRLLDVVHPELLNQRIQYINARPLISAREAASILARSVWRRFSGG